MESVPKALGNLQLQDNTPASRSLGRVSAERASDSEQKTKNND